MTSKIVAGRNSNEYEFEKLAGIAMTEKIEIVVETSENEKDGANESDIGSFKGFENEFSRHVSLESHTEMDSIPNKERFVNFEVGDASETPEPRPYLSNQFVNEDSLDDTTSSKVIVAHKAASISESQKLSVASRNTAIDDGNGFVNLLVFAFKALEQIIDQKIAKRSPLREMLADALQQLKEKSTVIVPESVSKSLCLACESGHTPTVAIALDCLGKLLNYPSFLEHQRADKNSKPLLEEIVNCICDCFKGEGTDERIQLQTIKALSNAVMCEGPNSILHSRVLLKSIRTVYNIHLLSRSSTNQGIAQVTLSQMIDSVFDRVRIDLIAQEKENDTTNKSSFNDDHLKNLDQDLRGPNEKITLMSFEKRNSLDQLHEDAGIGENSFENSDLLIKDAFLVFRSLCKLSSKPMTSGPASDIRSQFTRSKLLSLSLIYNTLNNHSNLIMDSRCKFQTGIKAKKRLFSEAIKPYLCLSLSRNSVSSTQVIFDISCEIFGLIIANMRTNYKLEIGVFLNEIYLPMLQMRTSSPQQKYSTLCLISSMCSNPKALVEMYLNYDCDRSVVENYYEKIICTLAYIISTPLSQAAAEITFDLTPQNLIDVKSSSLTVSALTQALNQEPYSFAIYEANIKYTALKSIVATLESLIAWTNLKSMDRVSSSKIVSDNQKIKEIMSENMSEDIEKRGVFPSLVKQTFSAGNTRTFDDPNEFEALKLRKNELQEGVKSFNLNPEKGLQHLLKYNFLRSLSPQDVAEFLMNTEGLSKAQIGEYLGEGKEECIQTMYYFVDSLSFTSMNFVEALRSFLQNFRLPGEAQKIDRFMLKFAERYYQNNPKIFANADTVYVLAYSVIMLNTDLHNPQVRNKMSVQDFVNNNRGINDGTDLSKEYLEEIFNEIGQREIILDDEHDTHAMVSHQNKSGVSLAENITNAFMGRNSEREAFTALSLEMGRKTEDKFHSLRVKNRTSDNGFVFYYATNPEHVGPMFEAAWTSFLAALSGPIQDSGNFDVIVLCLDGFKLALRIASLFELQIARDAFLGVLSRFTNLDDPHKMTLKHVEAIKTILTLAISHGNELKHIWHEILTRLSQLESLQMTILGLKEATITTLNFAVKPQSNAERKSQTGLGSSHSVHRIIAVDPNLFDPQVAKAITSSEITNLVESIFTKSVYLTGSAIVDFVRALCQVSIEEVRTSENLEMPRLFSLQKLVEISYYNMNRIRMEWTSVWHIIADHFNTIGTHQSTSLASFALDSLRQLSMKFLELDELPYFRFQKDFLKPFEHVIANTTSLSVKEMVLQCIQQMIQARFSHLKSGWLTIFNILSVAGRDSHESIVMSAFSTFRDLVKNQIEIFIEQDMIADITVCLTDFAKNKRFQKTALHASEMIQFLLTSLMSHVNTEKSKSTKPYVQNELFLKFAYPIFFALHDITMNGDDLEVRSRTLSIMLDGLKKNGHELTSEFWDIIFTNLLMPTFTALKSSDESTQIQDEEEMSLWISTTYMQAIKGIVVLFISNFDILSSKFEIILQALTCIICQNSDFLSKIGISSFEKLVMQLANKFTHIQWQMIINKLTKLFEDTRPDQIFEFRSTSVREIASDQEAEDTSLCTHSTWGTHESVSPILDQRLITKRREFQPIIIKCVLQLLLIEMLSNFLKDDCVLRSIPATEWNRIIELIDSSRVFARNFNLDMELRNNLLAIGFMRQLPNLLRQEIAATATLISVLRNLYADKKGVVLDDERRLIADRLFSMCSGVLKDYSSFKSDSQGRNIRNWKPVVIDILNFFQSLGDADLEKHTNLILEGLCEMIEGDSFEPELRQATAAFLRRFMNATYKN